MPRRYAERISQTYLSNVSLKGTVSVLDDEHLFFADIRSPGIVSNLRANPNIEVNVVDYFVRKGDRFKGAAQVLDAGDDFDRHVEFFSKRGLRGAPGRIRTIVVIRVDQARPLTSPGYDHVYSDEASARAYWIKYHVGEAGVA